MVEKACFTPQITPIFKNVMQIYAKLYQVAYNRD